MKLAPRKPDAWVTAVPERGKGRGLGDLMPAVLRMRGGFEEVGRPGVATIRRRGMGLDGMGGRGGVVPRDGMVRNQFGTRDMRGSERRGAKG